MKEHEEQYYNFLKAKGFNLLPIEEFRKSDISVSTQLAVIEGITNMLSNKISKMVK